MYFSNPSRSANLHEATRKCIPVSHFPYFINISVRNMKRGDQEDATIRCLLLTSVSTCFGHHYAHLQESKDPVTAFGVLFWFCWMWLVAIVGRCVVGCELICLNMFRASLCPSSGDQRPCYCIWCVVLVLLDVVGSGCGALRCSM